ncbi:hypothetical protein Salat_1182600 [Sesamum alatum]|uniref:Uncharacterized protein n=1 Tax=Sesamum alatum TaxID=300844 RepID=A0AAE1YF00_9LAMI|nr:hypothetical protein Salat_1182600 [Sesamum alatum]
MQPHAFGAVQQLKIYATSRLWSRMHEEVMEALAIYGDELLMSCSHWVDYDASEPSWQSPVSKLVDLYKESLEEWSKEAVELEGVIKAFELPMKVYEVAKRSNTITVLELGKSHSRLLHDDEGETLKLKGVYIHSLPRGLFPPSGPSRCTNIPGRGGDRGGGGGGCPIKVIHFAGGGLSGGGGRGCAAYHRFMVTKKKKS